VSQGGAGAGAWELAAPHKLEQSSRSAASRFAQMSVAQTYVVTVCDQSADLVRVNLCCWISNSLFCQAAFGFEVDEQMALVCLPKIRQNTMTS